MSNENKKYIKSFDVLRVIALLGVFLYHLMPNFVPSGYLGVVIFFVLAGFLTMKQAVDGGCMTPASTRDDKMSSPTASSSKHIGAGILSARSTAIAKIRDKILKLYPALVFTIIIVTVCMCCFFRNFLVQYPVDALSSIFSVNNYAQIFRNESYFEAMNSIKPLTHIWALSLEFQFYVAFFLFVCPFYNKSRKNKFLFIFFILTVASIVLSIHLVKNGVNLTRIYYGFDSRLATFLLGAMAALVADGFSEITKKIPAFNRLLEFVLILMMVYAMVVNFKTDAEVIEVIIIYSLFCSCLLILLYGSDKASVSNNSKSNGKISIFSKIINEIVKRSYVIYLVHYPIIIFGNRFLAHSQVDIKIFFLAIILATILISEIIYRLVNVLFFKHKNDKLSVAFLILLILIITSSAIVIRHFAGNVPIPSDKNDTSWLTNTTEKDDLKFFNDNSIEVNTTKNQNEEITHETIVEETETYDEEKKVDGIYSKDGRLLMTEAEYFAYPVQTVLSRIKSVNALIGGEATLTKEEFLEHRDMKISFIGDSVTQCSRGSLSVYFPNAIINAEGNRQLKTALPIFYDMKEKGELGDVVVVALGTNSDNEIRADVLEEIYENLDGRMMIILTVAIPYVVQEQQRNTVIRNFAETHDNCHLADWYSTMKVHKEYFVGDDTHPQGLGTDVYAQLIFKTAIESLQWRKVGNEWQYYGSDNKMKLSVEIEKNIGDTIKFGSYYINNAEEKEPIEWIIVDKNEELKTELLISKYALERKKYNDIYIGTTWQKSNIRKWLNNEFYNEAFENVGAKFIMTRALDNHQNPEYRSLESNKTYDKVFLPSYDELNKYIKDKYLKCKGTNYFKSIGGYVNENGYVDWWTRTPGDSDSHVVNVSANGKIIMMGDYVNTDDFGVRPMIKVTYK